MIQFTRVVPRNPPWGSWLLGGVNSDMASGTMVYIGVKIRFTLGSHQYIAHIIPLIASKPPFQDNARLMEINGNARNAG